MRWSRSPTRRRTGRFVIFAQGRTGSSLLRSLLNTHPLVRCDGELLADPVTDPLELVRSAAASSNRPVHGFKVKIYQLSDTQRVDPRWFLEALVGDGCRIITIQRMNLLRHAISNLMAENRGRYHDRVGESAERPKLTVDPDVIIDTIRRRAAHIEAERVVLEGLDHHALEYERDLMDGSRHQATMDGVFRHLGLNTVPVSTDLRRSVVGRLEDQIEEFAELRRALEAAGLDHYLDD